MVLGIGLVLSATMGIYAYMEITYYQRAFLNEQKEKAFDITDTVMKSIEYPMLDGEMRDVQEVLERVNALRGLEVAHLCDPDGVVRYSGQRRAIGEVTHSDITKQALTTQSLVKGLEIRDRKEIFRYAMPVLNEEMCHKCHGSHRGILGILTVGFVWDPISGKIKEHRDNMVTGFLICLALVITFMIALLHRLIIVPIERLTRAARAIAEGDMTEDIPGSKSRDEVGELINAFREMQQSLRQCYYRPTEGSEE